MPSSPLDINVPDARPLFTLTVDTEEEWDWKKGFSRPPYSTQNIEEIPAFQEFCKSLEITPTYFIDYAVADSTKHAQIIKRYIDSGDCDFGAHLHPWVNPPILEDLTARNTHAVNLPVSLFEKKLSVLTKKLVDTFEKHPYSYRAGRWGVSSEHIKVLNKLGYRIDSSVRPFYDYEQDFNYTNAPTRPFWPSAEDILEVGDDTSGILEIPSTSGYTRPNFEVLDRWRRKLSTSPINRLRLVGILSRLGILRAVTVTPEATNHKDVCACIDASIARGDLVINMFFHSSNLLPGNTAYVKDSADKARMLDSISRCVDHLRQKHNAQVTCMRDIRRQLTGIA